MTTSTEESLKTEPCYLLYLDFLGAKQKIEDDQDKWLNVIVKLYNDAVNFKKKTVGTAFPSELENSFVHIFSDNIAIGVKRTLSKNDEDAIRFLLYTAAHIQTIALHDYTWPVRGAVVSGKLYSGHNDKRDLIWGDALVKAVGIEEKNAEYPRILIDENVMDALTKNAGDTVEFAVHDDGFWYLDFLRVYMAMTPQDGPDDKTNLISDIESGLLRSIDETENQLVRQKLEWLRSYILRIEKDKTADFHEN